MSLIKKTLPIFLSMVAIGLVFYYVPPPTSWPEASTFQILAFLLPTLTLITFLINAFLDFFPRSLSIGLGAIMLLVLAMINDLNLALLVVTIITVIVLFTAFKKPDHKPRKPVNKS